MNELRRRLLAASTNAGERRANQSPCAAFNMVNKSLAMKGS
jgi:hypothetical protein